MTLSRSIYRHFINIFMFHWNFSQKSWQSQKSNLMWASTSDVILNIQYYAYLSVVINWRFAGRPSVPCGMYITVCVPFTLIWLWLQLKYFCIHFLAFMYPVNTLKDIIKLSLCTLQRVHISSLSYKMHLAFSKAYLFRNAMHAKDICLVIRFL